MLRKFVHSVNRMSSLALLTRNPSAYAIRAEVIFNLLLVIAPFAAVFALLLVDIADAAALVESITLLFQEVILLI